MLLVLPAAVTLAVALSMPRTAPAKSLEGEWQDAMEAVARFLDGSDLSAAKTAAMHAWALARGFGPDSRQSALSLNCLGGVYERQGRLSDAERSYNDAVTIWARLPEDDKLGLVTILNNLSHLYVQNGRFAEAEPVLKRTAAALAGHEPALTFQQVRTFELMFLVAIAQRRSKEATVLARRLVSLSERAYPPSHPEIAMAWNNLGLAALASGRPAQAIEPLSRAVELAQAGLGQGDIGTAIVIANLGQAYTRTNQLDMAESLLTTAVRLAEAVGDPDAAGTAKVLASYAELLRKRKRKPEAKSIEERVRASLADYGRASLGQTVSLSDLRQ